MFGDEDWFCDLDLSDLPQLPLESEVANLPLLDDVFLLDGTGSPDSVSSIWQPECTRSAGCHQQNEGFDVTDEDIETWKCGMTCPWFPMPARPLNSDEAGPPSQAEQASPLSSIGLSVGNTQCHAESAGTAQMHVGHASGSCAGNLMPDVGVEAQVDSSQKKQMRLLRNRELAFESRQRKKSYIKELESKCRVLEQECNQLQHQICLVSSENTVLKEELSRVKRKKGSTGVAEPAALKDSLPLEFLLHLTYLSFLAFVSLLGNLYLDLVLVSVHLQVSKVKAGGLGKREVNSNASYPALRISGCEHSSTALRKLCSFGFWRRRRKVPDMTDRLHHVLLWVEALCACSFMQCIVSDGRLRGQKQDQFIQSILVL